MLDGDDTIILSSDIGERDECRARRSDYWTSPRAEETLRRVEVIYSSQPCASTSRLPSPDLEERPPSPSKELLPSSSPLPDAAAVPPRVRKSGPTFIQAEVNLDSSLPAVNAPLRRSSSPIAQPPSPSFTIPPSPPAGRAFRQRTAVQQNPFTAEHARYAQTLHRNGWEDAVMRLPKAAREETAEEKAARLAEARRKGKDDLGGWLVLEDGTRVRREGYEETRREETPVDSESEPDFDNLFEGRKKTKKSHSMADGAKRPRMREYGSDDDRLRDTRDAHAPSRPEGAPPKKRRRRSSPDTIRADSRRSQSEPPTSTPPTTTSLHNVIDIDSDDSATSATSEPSERGSVTSRSAKKSRRHVAAADPKGLKGKRKKALGAMMPAAFFKRAKQDLELMRQERVLVSDGSGGEESSSVDEDGRRKKGRVRVRRRVLDSDDETGRVFDGEVFTDESNDGGDGSESSEEEGQVGDAVSNWLGAFAPKRVKAKKPGGRDMLDKLLIQSKRNTRRPAKKPKAKKQTRLPFVERQNFPHGEIPVQFRGNAAAKPRSSVPTIAVDADSLFLGRAPGAIPSVDVETAAKEAESWDAFTRFSHDFCIHRLPNGIAFSQTSYIGRGHLRDLIDSLGDSYIPLRSTLFAFGLTLAGDMPTAELTAQLPLLCDRLHTELSLVDEEDEPSPLFFDACDCLRWLASFLSAHRDDAAFVSEVDIQLTHLRSRLAALRLGDVARLQLDWAFLEVTLRNPSRKEGEASEAVQALVVRLMRQNAAHTVKALKAAVPGEAMEPSSSLPLLMVDLWVRLCRLAVDRGRETVEAQALWAMVEQASESRSREAKLHPIQATEALAFATMMICACSQFATTGSVTAKASLPSYWPAVTNALQRVSPAALAEDTSKLSNTALQRRDGYVLALFARCLVFVDRWGWKVDGREGLVAKLFDVLNARLLSGLTTDGPRDFPSFLQQYDGTVPMTLDRRGDTAFHIFLKLLIRAAKDQAGSTELEKRKGFNKLISRITPQRKLPFTRDALSHRLSLDRSALVNHYSLFMALAIAAPQSAAQRLSQIRNLLAFEEADDDARMVCLRAIMYLAIVYRHLEFDLAPLLAWLAHICRFVRSQYDELEARRRQIGKVALVQREADQLTREMYAASVTISTILRAVQHILIADAGIAKAKGTEAPYPDLALLDDAWIKDLFRSPLAQDPYIGPELIKCLDCFLKMRSLALAPHEVSGVSQDEFELDQMDYNDPALCAMLGIETTNETVSAIHKSDAAFAELAHTELSLGLFRLLTSAYAKETAKSRAAPVVNARLNVSFVDDLVACWARCAVVIVRSGKRTWREFVDWGDEVWKRVSDPLGRREVALRFLVHAVEADPQAFKLNAAEYLDVWLQTIVSKRLSVQHDLTNAILNLERTPTLLGDDGSVPLRVAPDEEAGRFALTLAQIEAGRPALLEAVFLRARRLTSNREDVNAATARKHLGSMCAAMRDNLESFDALDGPAKATYATFARQTVIKMQSTLAKETLAKIPALAVLISALDRAEAAAL